MCFCVLPDAESMAEKRIPVGSECLFERIRSKKLNTKLCEMMV